jgi:pyridoxal phosphate enzyme (YggS family)
VVELISGLRAERVRANVERVRAQLGEAAARAGRPPDAVELLAATKYVPAGEMPALARAGVRVVGENRAQDLEAKVAAHGELFAWDFIGRLQSRRVRAIVPHVRLIHSVASDSALRELERNRERCRPGMRILIEVNVAGEEGKAGVRPDELAGFIERAPVPVAGLMTMPPLASEAEESRPWFARLRELAQEHRLEVLSMGTSQDYAVAAEEGATIVRIGTILYS